MKEHKTYDENEGLVIRCNKCGKELLCSNGIFKEGVLQITNEWGYFSKKDLQIHQFHICEDCYEYMIEDFLIPVDIRDKKEVL